MLRAFLFRIQGADERGIATDYNVMFFAETIDEAFKKANEWDERAEHVTHMADVEVSTDTVIVAWGIDEMYFADKEGGII